MQEFLEDSVCVTFRSDHFSFNFLQREHPMAPLPPKGTAPPSPPPIPKLEVDTAYVREFRSTIMQSQV